jgi:hypothetical protein
VIFTERVAKQSGIGEVLATVRRYETFRRKPAETAKPSAPRPLEGLTIWYEPVAGVFPRVLTLTEGRALKEIEYLEIGRHTFMPEVAAVLPTLAVRVGDRWNVRKAGMRALLGISPGRGGPLTATLDQVRQVQGGNDREATITIKGKAPLPVGECLLNARVVFTFRPPSMPESAQPTAPEASDRPIVAVGGITDVRLGMTMTAPVPEGNGRLRQSSTRQLILRRQLAQAVAALAIPTPPPVPTEANSWLTYDDPEAAFHFRHPQDLHLGELHDSFVVQLFRNRPGEPDLIEINRQLKTGDPQADRENRNPDFLLKNLKQDWADVGRDALLGPMGWLPDAEWAPLKMKVYRINAALRAKPGAAKAKGQLRTNSDSYLILFTRDESLVIEATTVQDPPSPFRREVEAMIKTFAFGPSTQK